MAGSNLLSVAPMMDCTDIYYRCLARLLSRHTWLYTEMIVDQTVRHNPDTDRFLWFPIQQHPIACQLGGSNPENLKEAAQIVSRYSYDEINLNCGCPSDRVAGAGCFGAALMLQPKLVGDCMKAIQEAVHTPVTVKCRLGVDHADSYDELCKFVEIVSKTSGVNHFILHARKCHLKGLNPHQNRTIPPLRYEWVFALARDFPDIKFSLNGGVKSCEEAVSILEYKLPENCKVRSVMIGRAAYEKPWKVLGNADVAIFGAESNPARNRRQVLREYAAFADEMLKKRGIVKDGQRKPSIRVLMKPVLNLFHGERGSKKWKQAVDAEIKAASSVTQLINKTISTIPDVVLDAAPGGGPPVTFSTGSLPTQEISLQDFGRDSPSDLYNHLAVEKRIKLDERESEGCAQPDAAFTSISI